MVSAREGTRGGASLGKTDPTPDASPDMGQPGSEVPEMEVNNSILKKQQIKLESDQASRLNDQFPENKKNIVI